MMDAFLLFSGVTYKTGDVISHDADTCSYLICSEVDVYTTRPNNGCLIQHTCTVSGPAVIDISGRVNSVQDRCAHSLMLLPSAPNFHVLANFQERRRKDVSFLDSVTLRLDGPRVDIHLQQGGRVQLNDTTLTLNSSVLEVHGVELSKDHTGVTAKVVLTDYNTSVSFDGNTAHISVTRIGAIESLQGLCGNSSRPLSDVRLSQDSTSGCEVLHSDSADPAINCSAMTKRCNLLNEAPFTACHNHTDPAPYITACTDTLCKYPAVDRLSCQFLEAYAKACRLYSNITLEDWRSNAGCSAPRAPCQDRFCNAHEFCAEKASGEDGCFCRALFASPYRSTGTLGDPTVCERSSASVSLVGCLLEEKGIDYSTMHLNDNSCAGQMDEQTHMVTFSFSDSNFCGTVVSVNNSQIIYKNTIMTHNHTDVIVRHDQVSIDFSCFYTQPDIRTMAFRIKDSRTRLVESSTEITLNQKIWVQLETDGLGDGLVAVVTDACWATNQALTNGSLRHDLISNGCASRADQTVEVKGNGQGTSNYFSFNMFQFTGSSADVYLHCRLNLCVKQNNACAPNCSGAGSRRRRSARSTYVDGAPAFITMAWTN
ncbi:Alpha-tectorin [Nibea albiflora]|uniref:Alpha-tectorin n=1 Tax=Nibea albiflora TaxID=240163 RepID=A0ACB7FFE6_NIBAL|nr:Alpha-tectorin [Nibea albiflora]